MNPMDSSYVTSVGSASKIENLEVLLGPFFKAPFQMTSLKMYHRVAQPTSANKCLNNNCEKNQVCMPKVRGNFASREYGVEEKKSKNSLPYTCFGGDLKEQLEGDFVKSQFYSVIVYLAGIIVLVCIGMVIGVVVRRKKISVSQGKYELPTFSALLINDAHNVIHNTQDLGST